MSAVQEKEIVSVIDPVAGFNPTVFSLEAAKTLQTLLDRGSYRDSLRLPRPSNQFGLSEPGIFLDYFKKESNCWGSSVSAGIYRKLLHSEKGPAPVHLFDLFWMGQPIDEEVLLDLISEGQLELLSQSSVVSRLNGFVRANIRCIALPHLYAMFDIDRSTTENFVYFGTDSKDMVEILKHECAGRQFKRSIDLCTGSGVQGLTLAMQSEEVLCTDLNSRALFYVKANAMLNDLKNVHTCESNLFANATGKFDCITANTPYVPMPDDPNAFDLPMRGGDLGTEFTFTLLEQALDHWSSDGMAVIYTSDPIMGKGAHMQQEITRKFGHLSLEFTLLQIFRTYPDTERQRQHFQKHKMLAFDDCVLIVRHASRFSYQQRPWRPLFYWRSKLLRTEFSSDPTA